MPFQGRWDDLPESEEDLTERILEGFNAGVAQGRIEGGREVANKILDWVQNRYLSPDVKRKTPFAEDILKLAGDLAQALRTSLKEVDSNPGETRSKKREFERKSKGTM